MPDRIAHRGALLTLVTLVVAGALGALYAFSGPSLDDQLGGGFLLVAAGAVVASCRPVRISRLRIDMVPFHPFVLVALALFGIRSAVLLAVMCIITAASLRNELPPVLRVVFNLGSTTLATIAAGLGFRLAGGRAGGDPASLAVPLLAAAAVFFLVKTALVAGAIALEIGQGCLATWNRSLRWTAIPDLAGIPIALGAVAVFGRSPVLAVLVAFAPCAVLWLFYRAVGARRPGGDAATSAPA
jgi:hypothetical protein